MDSKIILVILLWLPLFSFAQDLRNDIPFFEKEAEAYQKWLNYSGFGEILQYREMEVKEKELTLFLEFQFQDIDSIANSWKAIKAEFEATHPISLEQQLFYKLTSLFEVRASAARIAIFDTYDFRKEPLFLRGIYFEKGKVKVEISNPRSEIREVFFTADKVGGENVPAVEDFQKRYTKAFVFSKIKTFSQQHFTQKTCKQKNPEMRIIEDEEVLRFKVVDLCREVLVDAADPLLAQILNQVGFDVDWVKREKLEILIAYEQTEKGFKLHITIDGKYGSGLYSKVGRNGYYSMDIEFKDYLKDYADAFKNAIKKEVL